MDVEQEQSQICPTENSLLGLGRRSSRIQQKGRKNYGSMSDLEQQHIDSSSEFRQDQKPKKLDFLIVNSRPKRNDRRQNYAELQQDDEENHDSQVEIIEEELAPGGVFSLEIDQVLWRREKMDTCSSASLEGPQITREYLVKYKDRSYLHTEWLKEDDIINGSKQGKQKLNRFNKTFDRKLLEEELDNEMISENQYFDPAYTEVDRILSTTEIFPIVHPKKGSEIKGKWCESLVTVVSKLLNFVKNNIKYGVYFMEPVNPEKDGCPNYRKVINQPMDLGTINNRLYLGYYKDFHLFWSDLGLVFKNCRRYNNDPNQDIRILCDTLRECSIELYRIWHQTQMEKYNNLIEQKKYNDDEETQSKIDTQKLNEFKEELIVIDKKLKSLSQINKLSMMQTNIISKMEQAKMKVEDDDITPLIDVFKSEYNITFDASLITFKQDDDILKQIFDQIRPKIEIDESLMEQKMQEFQMVMKQLDQNIEQHNPGEFSYNWLDELNPTEFKYLTLEDRQQLSQEVDKLYLIKWKHLSYSEATWEQESVVGCQNRIIEFRAFNRSLDKETRQLMIQQNQRHKSLLDFDLKKKKFSTSAIQEIKNQLYFYEKQREQPFLYTQANQTIYKDRKLLRDYQLESLNWLIQSWYEDRNVILADEMGLGKTIQAIAFLNHLYAFENCRGPFLVIAPLSTLEHWKRTVEDWTNLNGVLYYDQNGSDGRSVCRYYEWFYTDISTKGAVLQAQDIHKFQILITSYEVFLLDVQNVLSNVPFQFIVVDEAHRLKNQNARILQALKKLPCKRNLLLTGTPIQNNTDELFSLLNFIEPAKFPTLYDFKLEFGDLTTAEQIEKLNKVLKPYILRRQKEDVESMIPPLQETIIDIEMTTIQKTIYRALYERNKNMLLQGFSQTAASATQLNNLEIQLRKCCNHPFLIKEMQNELSKNCRDAKEYFDIMIESSGKMILLDKLLDKFRAEHKKVLIFSQFTFMLQLLEDYLKYKTIKYEKIDGQIKARERQNAIDRFNDPTKNRKVFLLSTKAGGQGINLTAAEIVIIYDSDWNPQNDVQATARAHRIGQSKEVTVYRLVTKSTYEAEMFERATKKLGLDQAIFMGGHFKKVDLEDFADLNLDPKNRKPPSSVGSKNEKKLTKQEIEILLKKGILGLVESEQQNQGKNDFFEQNIDEILERNSRMAKYSLINGTYTISKQSFVSEKTDQTLNLQDPNFWQIILKNTESKSQKILKSFDEQQHTITSSLQEQKRFMFDVADCVNQIVESKLAHSNYNADDEKNITELLNKVNISKNIIKQYRELALNWMYEINKPSRRFKKIQLADLELNSFKTELRDRYKQSFNVELTKPYLPQQVQHQNQEITNKSFIEGEDAKRLAQKSKDELVKKLCYICEKANCSFYCMGFCRRAFHESCRKFLEEKPDWINIEGVDQQFLEQNDFWELKCEESELKNRINIKFVCPDCRNNKILCYICKKKGNFYQNDCTNVKKSSTKMDEEAEEIAFDDEEQNQDNNDFDGNLDENENDAENKILKIPQPRFKQNRLKQANELSKCSTANCNKYFHLQCIKDNPNSKMLDQSTTLFRCPAHVCAYCKINSSNTTTALIHCVRCCKSFHIKCAPMEVKNKIEKVGKKIMICDQCNKHKYQIKLNVQDVFEKNKNDTVIKIPFSTANIPNPKTLKQQKLNFKTNSMMKQARTDKDFIEPTFAFQNEKIVSRNRRRIDLSRSNSLERSQMQLKKKIPREKKKLVIQQLTYEDFGIIPVSDFDYSNYKNDWCRYCGARFASNFTKGPWGSRTLCTIHYINWGQKRTLDLSQNSELPNQPINRDDLTELQYLQRVKAKDPQFDPRRDLDYYNEDMYRLVKD